jgi:hypothetical protein
MGHPVYEKVIGTHTTSERRPPIQILPSPICITLATYQENMIFLLLKGCSESSETILKFIVLAFNKSKLFETLQIIVHT